jgi:ankyrin repeat protein
LIKGIVHEEAKNFTSSRSNRKLLYEALIETVEWNEKLAESVKILLTNVPASEVEDLQYIRRFFTLRRPESLQCICRRHIRNAIKGNILQGIRKLCVAKAIKRFLALNFDIDFHNPVDILDLNLAIQEENVERVKHLIKTGIDINFTFTDHTPLTETAKLGNLELFKSLLKEGAVIDLPDNTGFNSLHWAAALGHLHIIQECIFRGADVNKLDEFHHENATTIAAKNGHFDSLIYLLDHGTKPTVLTRSGIHSLHFAAGSGNIGAVRGLLQKHVSPDTRDFHGNTPLHVAASRGLLYTSRNISLPALFPNEVAMNLDGIRNNMGLEPSMKYFKNSIEYENSVDHLGVIKLLMDAGADKLAINSTSMTPLDVAMQYKCDNIIVLLR